MRTTETSAVVRRLAAQGHCIGDEWRASTGGGTFVHRYAATGAAQAEVALAGTAELDAAVEAARAAQPAWAALAPVARAAVLHRLADLLDAHAHEAAELGALDNGSPVSVMQPGHFTAGWVRYYAGWCDKLDGEVLPAERGLSYVRLEPFGVVGAIPPWNGSMMGMGQKCAPALAAGNAVVAKPPELAPFGPLRFAELALEAGLPPGVLNVVIGDGVAGRALVGHPGVAKISFTGGTATARSIMTAAAEHLTPLALELGGKSAHVVFADANLDLAATVAATLGTALLSGQGCALPTRSYVQADIYDAFVERMLQALAGFAVGDPLDPATFIGPVVTEAAMHRILGVVERARADGATLLHGGVRLGGDLADGWFVAPTVFGDVAHASELAREEVFGPVHAIVRFERDDDIVAMVNDNAYGLAAYVHTADAARVQRMVAGCAAGSVVVNGFGGYSPAAPFGGVKQSGFGREGGRAGIEEMVWRKTVHMG